MALDFSTPHPTYSRLLAERLEARDFYRGGRYVIDPDRAVGNVAFPPARTDAPQDAGQTEADSPRSRSRFEYEPTNSYLYSHVRESKQSYNDRASRADHYPVFRNVIDIYGSAVLRTEPQRDDATGEPWKTYHDDVDRRGTNIAAFVRQATSYALCYHIEFALTDKPRSIGPVASREQELAMGGRAYSYLVSPLDLINWSIDEDTGEFRWIVIREREPDTRAPGEQTDTLPPYQYRVWTTTDWKLYRANENKTAYTLAGQGDHPVGEVPLAVLYARRGHDSRLDLEPDGMLSGLQRNDRSIFNAMSLLDDQIYKQGFSTLALPQDLNSQGPYHYDVGPDTALLYDGSSGAPMMLSPEAAVILAQWTIIGGKLQMSREREGVGRGKAEYSKEERSGEAVMQESRNEFNRAALLAEAIEEFDHRLHRHVAAWEGQSEYPRANYSRDVSLRSLQARLAEAVSLKAAGVPAEAMVEILRPLVIQHMKESGLGRDAIDAATTALERRVSEMEQQMSGSPSEEREAA
jgi:hypothetical protein